MYSYKFFILSAKILEHLEQYDSQKYNLSNNLTFGLKFKFLGSSRKYRDVLNTSATATTAPCVIRNPLKMRLI